MNTRIVLGQRPAGWVDQACFGIAQIDEPVCGPQDVLLQAVYFSTDPYLRCRMNGGPSHAPGFEVGRPIYLVGCRHGGPVGGATCQARRPG